MATSGSASLHAIETMAGMGGTGTATRGVYTLIGVSTRRHCMPARLSEAETETETETETGTETEAERGPTPPRRRARATRMEARVLMEEVGGGGMTLAATLPSYFPGRDKLRGRRLEGAGPLRCRGCRGWWEGLPGQAGVGWRRGREAPWGKEVRREAGMVQGRWPRKALEGRS